MNLALTATVAAFAAVAFGYLYWQKIWLKTQCWLLVAFGMGVAGTVGGWLSGLLDTASSAAASGTARLFGTAVPGVLMLWIVLAFAVEMLPDRVVRSKPVSWHTRICAILLPTALAVVPTIGGQIGDGAAQLLGQIGV